MAYDLIKISALPAATPDESQEIVVGVGDLAKRINYGDVKADMVGTSPSYTTDTEPYLMRQTANIGVVGKCALNKLVGGSLGWNQLVQNGNFASTSNWTAAYGSFTVSGNVATITATAQWGRISQNVSVLSGHKYLFGADLKGTTNNYAQFGTSQYLSGTSWEHISFLYSATSTTTVQLMIGDKSTSGWQAFNAQNVQVLDLTAMFGSTIADYVYGLGSTNGIAWLSRYIDLGTYHAYDAGSIQSVQATAHVTTGKNLLPPWSSLSYSGVTFLINADGSITASGSIGANGVTGAKALVLPKGTYTVSGGDENSAIILQVYNTVTGGLYWSRGTTSTFTYNGVDELLARIWVKGGSAFSNVTIYPQVEFGSTATSYEPYMTHTYPLGSDTLRGVPQLVSNKLRFDGDVKTPDGTIRRRYGAVDLGTLNWGYATNYGGAFYANVPSEVANNVAGGLAGVCGRYALFQGGSSEFTSADKVFSLCNQNFTSLKRIQLKDSAYTDQATFKASVSGVYLVYPLETESTESSTSFQKVQTIDADGTESFTTSSPVPIGHETQTPDNILAALEWLGE